MSQFIRKREESFHVERPWTMAALWSLRTILALTVAVEVWSGHLLYAGEALIALALCTLSPALLRVDGGPSSLDVEIVFLLMAIGNCTLGIVFNFYRTVPYYDKALHLLNPVVLTYYAVAYLGALEGGRHPYVSPVTIAVTGVLIILGASAVWEILEYASDNLLGSSTQGSPIMGPLDDTMWDLFLGLLGGIVGAAAAMYTYLNPGREATRSRSSLGRTT